MQSKYYNDLETIGINVLKPRSTWMPYDSIEKALTRKPETSYYYQSLNGEWQFSFYKHPGLVPSSIGDIDDSSWDKIPVPSCWQMLGYGQKVYANVQYPYPVDEPYIPNQNPTGVYRRVFDLEGGWDERRTIIHFGGVCAAFNVYINGVEIGYSEGSHMPSEFDITEYVTDKDNQLTVVVYKWSTSSYIEDQDFWRLNGIFRDVILYSTSHIYTEDVFVKASLSEDLKQGHCEVTVDICEKALGEYVTMALYNDEGVMICSEEKQSDSRTLSFSRIIDHVKPWSAETPYLYTLVVTLSDGIEISSYRVGFRNVDISNSRLYINGQSIVLKGVNRHDMHPERGYAVTKADMEQDIILMKQHNINMLRTAHYPNDPYIYDLCDRLGIYVMDEADIEIHGYVRINDLPNNGKEQIVAMNNDPRWSEIFVDRAIKMVERDKNVPSIISWSLGNESASGENHRLMAEWIRAKDDTRFIHYESAGEEAYVDVVSYMYPSIEKVHDEAHRTDETRPFFLCEFMHAMGNAMGEARDFWDIMFEENRLIGGCIWEWADHGILTKNDQGESYYAYGGDFGDDPHDWKFCIDGAVYPDRTPKNGLIELKNVIAPVQIKQHEGNLETITVVNRYDFMSLGHLKCHYILKKNGLKFIEGDLLLPDIMPHSSSEVSLPKEVIEMVSDQAEYILDFNMIIQEPLGYEIDMGPVYTYQMILSDYPMELTSKEGSELRIEENDYQVSVVGDGFKVVFDTYEGTFTSYEKEGQVLMCDGPREDFFRAPTDNDEHGWELREDCDAGEWRKAGLDMLWRNVVNCGYKLTNEGFVFETEIRHGKPSKHIAYVTKSILTLFNSGELSVEITYIPVNVCDTIPKLGSIIKLPQGFEQVKWYGRGPMESYIDRKESALIGTYESTVSNLFTDYVIPQGNGNHTDTRYIEVSDTDGQGIRIVAENTFDFTASHITTDNLYKAMHPYDLKPVKETLLQIDYAQHGIGNASCGFEVMNLEKYCVPIKETLFKYRVIPLSGIS